MCCSHFLPTFSFHGPRGVLPSCDFETVYGKTKTILDASEEIPSIWPS